MAQLDSYNPIGTLDELEEMKLDPRTYFSCSESTTRNRGCRHCHICTMAFKMKSRQAPENIGVYRESAQSDAVKVQAMACYRYYDHLKEWKENGDTVQVIAQVGDLIPVHETVENPREQQVHLGRLINKCEHVEVHRPVPKFPRPSEILQQRSTALKVRQEIKKIEEEKTRRSVMGEPATVPEGSDADQGGAKRR